MFFVFLDFGFLLKKLMFFDSDFLFLSFSISLFFFVSSFLTLTKLRCFGIASQRGTQLDPSKAIVCNFGSDSLSDIGAPPGAARNEYESGRNTRLGKWKAAVEDSNIYPAEEDEMMDAILADVDTGAWLETAVDACRSERDDALVRYRKGVERKARLNKA